MDKLKEKLARLGVVRPVVYSGSDAERFQEYLVSFKKGILVANENSMIDTERIDFFDGGNVTPQTVNLESMTGNENILNMLRTMKRNKSATFFPGTLLNDFGGFVLPVMPIISEGNLLGCRIKLTALPLIDDNYALAVKLFGAEYAERMRSESPRRKESMLRDLLQKARKISANLSQESLKSYEIKGLNVLPLICNEISTALQSYNGNPLDVITHSSDSLFENNDDRLNRYERVLGKAQRKGLVNTPLVIIVAEDSHDNPYGGLLSYADGKVRKIN